MTPEQRSAYIAQQMSQFQGKQLRSLFPKGQARGWGMGGENSLQRKPLLSVFLKALRERREVCNSVK